MTGDPIDRDAYLAALLVLPESVRASLLTGDWA